MMHVRDRWLLRLAVGRGLIGADVAAAMEAGAIAGAALLDRWVAEGALTRAEADALLVEAERKLAQSTAAGESPSIVDSTEGGRASPGRSASLLPRTFGPYEVVGEVGRGAMGVVIRARDPRLGREVAIKTLLSGLPQGEERLTRFLREARIAAGLQHPGIVPILDVGVADGVPWFAMDLVQGTTLDQAIASGAVPDLPSRVRLLAQVARAVAHAHDHQIVHRDLKPDNILVDAQGWPRVLDFGLALQLDLRERLTSSGQVLGTPIYMSPEQIDGRAGEVGPASDVYSLGAVLYEVISGVPPISGGEFLDLLARIARVDPEPLSRRSPGIPADLAAVVHKALDKAPRRRYPNAAALADDLERWLSGAPVLARPPGALATLVRRLARHPAALAAALVPSLLVLGFAWQGWRAASERSAAVEREFVRGESLRQAGDVFAARDAYQRALALDPSHAGAVRGMAWARAQADEASRKTEEALRKAGLVQRVLQRWAAFFPVVLRIQSVATDSTRRAPERRAACLELWERFQPFVTGTPDDPTSQAVMRAFAGWVLLLSGDERGREWIADARARDPEVPYAGLLDAWAGFSDYLARVTLPPIVTGPGTSIRFSREGEETPDMARLRADVVARLAGATSAPLWGFDAAEEFRPLREALESIPAGRAEESVAQLTAALDAALLQAFRPQLLIVRARQRCMLGRFDDALADLAEVEESCPACGAVWIYRALAYLGRGQERAVRGEDPMADFEAAGAVLEERLGSIRDTREALAARMLAGIVHMRRGRERRSRGGDPRADFLAAHRSQEEVLRLAPPTMTALHNAANGLIELARVEQAAGKVPRELLLRAIAHLDRAVVVDPGHVHQRLSRADLCEWVAAIEWHLGDDPLPWYARARADFREFVARGDAPAVGHLGAGRTLWFEGGRMLELGRDARTLRDEAVAELESAVADPSQASEAGTLLAQVSRARADEAEDRASSRPWLERALAAAREAVALDRANGTAWTVVVLSLLDLGRFEEGKGSLREALAAVPETNPASAELKKTADLLSGPRAAWAFLLREADRRFRAGEYAAAREAYESALAAGLAEALAALPAERSHVAYRLARIHAVAATGRRGPDAEPRALPTGEVEARLSASLAELERAVDLGLSAGTDPAGCADLSVLTGDPRWDALLRKLTR